MRNDLNLCDLCIFYLVGECSTEEQEKFEYHLLSCPSCQEELRNMQSVWNALPLQMEEMEVPTDLKEEVMRVIFSQNDVVDDKRQTRDVDINFPVYQAIHKNKKRSFWSYYTIASLTVLLAASVIWNAFLFQESSIIQVVEQEPPSQIVEMIPLKALNPAFESAQGMVCLLKKGDRTKLVVYILGLNANQGSEAYQVWLQHGGEQNNAGTFRVNQNGFGVFVFDMEPNEQFDAVGITVEPDENSTKPNGPKVLGT